MPMAARALSWTMEPAEERWKGAGNKMVGLGGLEPPTSPLSGARSSHLSYRPNSNYEILAGPGVRVQLHLRGLRTRERRIN